MRSEAIRWASTTTLGGRGAFPSPGHCECRLALVRRLGCAPVQPPHQAAHCSLSIGSHPNALEGLTYPHDRTNVVRATEVSGGALPATVGDDSDLQVRRDPYDRLRIILAK